MGAEATQPERRQPWDGVVRREIAVSVRVLDQEDRSVEVIASTEALDSHGDIVKQYWDLSRYNKNGPVLWNHNIHESSPYSFGGAVRPEDTMPVGKGEDVRVDAGRLVAKLVLVKGTPADEPLVDKLWRRIQQGVVRAVSVGFRPGQITRILNVDGSTNHFELGSADRPNELREISFVPMGSNPEAVAKSLAFERAHFARMAGTEPATAEGNDIMAMTHEEKQAYDLALKSANDEKARAEKAERELAAEKTASAELSKQLGAASERATKAEGLLVEQEISALVGKKITPAEKDEQIALAKEIGLERVKGILAKRPDVALTQPVRAAGETVSPTAPVGAPPVAASDASGDIAKAATEAANRAA